MTDDISQRDDSDEVVAFAEVLDPYDGSRHDWLMPLLLYLEHSLLNDGMRSAQGRLGDTLAPELLANLWRQSASQQAEFAALSPWTDLRESEWARLAALVGDATEGAALAGWRAITDVYRDALEQFEREFPSAQRRDRSSEDPG